MTVLVLLHVGHATVHAQELAGTFDQLRVLVKPGDKITVTDDAGRETSGRLVELSSTSLALIVDDERRDLPASEVNTIRQRRSDPLANGAKWGLGIGAALGLAAGLALSSGYDNDDDGALVGFGILIYGGLGAGIGAGVDALISGNQVIYARRTASSSRVTIRPLVTPQRRGVVLAVGF
jgi:hypothetical protein